MIDSEEWNCIWAEMITNKKNRAKYDVYNFDWCAQPNNNYLHRLISKYNIPQYSSKATANVLLSYLRIIELNNFDSGIQVLTERDLWA